MNTKKIEIFDSTLRDGAQGCNICFSVQDKLNILHALDKFGVDFIEAGNPTSNPKDMEFFKKSSKCNLVNAKLVAFGSTRRKNISVSDDTNIISLNSVDVPIVSIFGKSWDMQVTQIIQATHQENLNMIYDTILFFKNNGKEVFFDAEHFFDGYKSNPEYALLTLKIAVKAGASLIVLCDTNGGCFPNEIADITKFVVNNIDCTIGVHCHNDTGCAVANTIMAVGAGASHVQGTFIGVGERCGNANLSAIIPNLKLKLGYSCFGNLSTLTQTARYIAEISNILLADNKPYVGRSAFSHKGGMHVDGVMKNSTSFEHIPPEAVGNERNFLLSEVAGRNVLLSKLSQIAPELSKDSPNIVSLMQIIKEKEHNGFQYEAADASFEILVKKYLKKLNTFFEIDYCKIIGEMSPQKENISNAIVKVKVGERTKIVAAEGDGPVNAIDKALRQALRVFYPMLDNVYLIDYKVRVVDSSSATAAIVRVLIETTNGHDVWTTVGSSSDIITASVQALVDSIWYALAHAQSYPIIPKI